MAAAALIWPALRQRPSGLARQRRAGRPAADGAQAGAGLILTGSRHAFGAADMTPAEVPRRPPGPAVNGHRLHVVFEIPVHVRGRRHAAAALSPRPSHGTDPGSKPEGDERMNTPGNHTARASQPSSVPSVQETSYLSRPEGRIGYDVAGDGALVVLVPGMGDLRAGCRFLAPGLRAAGYRVACTDLRGHGDSDTTFALLRRRGNSWRCHRPDRGTRRPGGRGGQLDGRRGRGPRRRAATRAWSAAWCWSGRSSATARPARCSAFCCAWPWHRHGRPSPGSRTCPSCTPAGGQRISASTATRSWRAFAGRDTRRRSRAPRAPATTRREARLADVTAPALVVMGEQDPDFPDPRAEADWIARALRAQVVMVPEAGHYPQSQRPDITTGAVLRFLESVKGRA